MQANRHTSHLLGINGNWKIASSSTRSQTTLTQQIASICPLWGRKFTRTPTAGCTQERRDPADPASPRSPANAWLPNSTRNVGPSRHAALHSLSRSPQPSTLHQTPSPSGGGGGSRVFRQPKSWIGPPESRANLAAWLRHTRRNLRRNLRLHKHLGRRASGGNRHNHLRVYCGVCGGGRSPATVGRAGG